jgi:hypothetical protein
MGLYNVPNVNAEILDGNLRIQKPVNRPVVLVMGNTDASGLVLSEPYTLEDRNDLRSFHFADGTPSPMSKAIAEAFDGGAKSVEAVVASALKTPTDDQLYDAYASTYSVLMNHGVDHVVPAGVGIDTPVGTGVGGEERNFAYQLANFCYASTVNNNSALGFIGVAGRLVETPTGEAPTLAELEAWVAAAETYDTSAYTDGGAFAGFDGVTDDDDDGIPDNYRFWAAADGKMPSAGIGGAVKDALGNPVDIGAYLNVLAMHVYSVSDIGGMLNPENKWYYHNGAATYSGFVTTLPARRAPTNLALPGTRPSRKLSLTQSSRLATQRFVALVTKSDGIKIGHAVTGAYNISDYYRSDYNRLSTVRTVHDVIDRARKVSDPFLGMANNHMNRLALETELQAELVELENEGTLNPGSDMSIISTPTMNILGQLLIDFKLDVPLEIRDITIRAGLVPPGQFT